MRYFLFLDSLRWYVRLPLKVLVALLAVTLVTFPYPQILIKNIEHWQDPNALVDAESASIQPLIESLQPEIQALSNDHEKILKTVERKVYEVVPYDWDWNTWGTADYMPTVEEVMAMGREDCDGRAVVAASVLRNFGYDARLVTDFSHVWVTTEHGDTMGPGKQKAIEGGKKGVSVNLSGLVQMPQALAFGVAVFPLERELILVAVFWWLSLRRRGGALIAVMSLLLLANGLMFLRAGGADFRSPERLLQWLGILNLVVAVILLWIVQFRQVRRAEADISALSA
ncbi:MAG: transglutaminase-like domain-containing protein [Phycisphaerae bacterium]